MRYFGGNGHSIEEAILINKNSEFEGVAAEYEFLELKYGKRDVDWYLKKQILLEENGKHYDKLIIKLKNGQELIYYFDISLFYGKL